VFWNSSRFVACPVHLRQHRSTSCLSAPHHLYLSHRTSATFEISIRPEFTMRFFILALAAATSVVGVGTLHSNALKDYLLTKRKAIPATTATAALSTAEIASNLSKCWYGDIQIPCTRKCLSQLEECGYADLPKPLHRIPQRSGTPSPTAARQNKKTNSPTACSDLSFRYSAMGLHSTVI